MTAVIIDDILPLTQAIATSGQTVYSTDWTANYATDVVVYSRATNTPANDVTQILATSAYTVAFIGGDQTVQVTLITPSTLGDVVTITRMTPADRQNLYTNTNFTPSMLNNDFGILTLVDQQAQLVNEQIAPRYNYSELITNIVDTILPILGPNETWVKNPGDTAIVTYELPQSGIAPAEDTYVLLTPDSALPNSFALSSLGTGLLVNNVGGNTLVVTTILGTTNQITVTNGDGLGGNVGLAISSNPIMPGTAGMGIPSGTTGQRVTPGSNISLRYNTTIQSLEYYDGGWVQLSDNTSVNPGLINELAYYAASGDSVSGLTTANDSVLTTSSGGVPTWLSELSLALGGTNNSLTASAGGIVWSDATKLNILAGTSTAGLPLLSGNAATPAWAAFALSLGGALTTAGALTTVGAFGATFNFSNTTNVTFPTSGTLATTGGALTTINADSGSATVTTNAFTISGGTTGLTTTGATSTINLTGTLGIAHGGTGVTSVTIAPTASAFAGWDANKNFSADNFIEGYATTATAAATTTLTVDSVGTQFFTGSTTQTVVMPVTSTLVLGQQYYIVNTSSGNVTIQSSGANTIQVMASGTSVYITCILTSGTTDASWHAEYAFNGGSGTVTNVATGAGLTGGPITTTGTISLDASITIGASAPSTSVNIAGTTGYTTLPKNPKFSAHPSGLLSNVTGDGTVYTIIYNTATLNVGTNYSTSTGLFTAPVTGFYCFTVTMDIQSLGVGHTNALAYFNVSTGAFSWIYQANPVPSIVSGEVSMSAAYCVQLTAADTVGVVIQVSGSTKTVNISNLNIFSGFLVP